MPKIEHHTNNIPKYSYNNQTLENPVLVKENKIASCIYEMKNSIQKNPSFLYKDRSGLYPKKLDFSFIDKLNVINTSSYIYGGLTNFLHKNNFGIALDDKGELLIITGECYNLFKGIYKKNTKGYRYQSANLTNHTIQFKQIYINNLGILIGEEKNTNTHYSITLEKISSPLEKQHQCITLSLKKCAQEPLQKYLTLRKSDATELIFNYQKNRLYLHKIQTPAGELDYSIMEYDIHFPLRRNYSIQSAKEINNHLQIELRKGTKNRIVYLSPEHILLKKLTAKRISHKPPQNLTSRLGRDLHEKYHAGQPFTSDRKGNFSSDGIPLLSSIVDKFRIHIQSAKEYTGRGENKKAFIEAAKSIDPGINALYQITKKKVKNIREDTIRDRKIDKTIMLNSLCSQTENLLPSINYALGDTLPANLSHAIILLMKQLKIQESISLENTNTIAGFFGVAAGGMPFNPGWFSGLVLTLARSYHLVLSREDNDNIRVTFSQRQKKGSAIIAGTGQGLERTLFHAQAIDYMTVMPAEANLILVAHCAKEYDFSFVLSINHFETFATQLYLPEGSHSFNQQLIDQSILKEKIGKELIIMLETKSEIRAQIGALVNSTTYMVMPRSALGLRLALNLLDLKSISEKTIESQEEVREDKLSIKLFSPEAELFHEEKIMPIAMRQDVNLWCYPLPLIEEYRPIKTVLAKNNSSVTREKQVKKTSNKVDKNEIQLSEKLFNRSFSLRQVDNIPLIITIDSSHSVEEFYLQKSQLDNKPIRSLQEKICQIKKALVSQERDSLHKQCTIFLSCYYHHHEDDYGIKKYQLARIEIRRRTTLNHLTATIPLAIFRLMDNDSISYNELLGEIDLLYLSQEDEMPSSVNYNLHIFY